MRLVLAVLAAMAVGGAASPARAETPEEWVALGARVHGGFGSFIPVGIRIGLDALQRLDAKPREVTVTYYDSDKAPCACIADGGRHRHCYQRGTTVVEDCITKGARRSACSHHRARQENRCDTEIHRSGQLD